MDNPMEFEYSNSETQYVVSSRIGSYIQREYTSNELQLKSEGSRVDLFQKKKNERKKKKSSFISCLIR